MMAVLLVWTGSVTAAELMVKVPAEEYRQTKSRLDALEEEISQLKQEMKTQPQQADTGGSSDRLRKLNRDISEIYDTLDDVETKSLLDRISLGAELRIRMDNYIVDNYTPITYSASTNLWTMENRLMDENNDGNWSSRMRINMEADVSRTVKFHGRLQLYKNWADSDGRPSDDTNRAQRAVGDAQFKVDRFYVDWIPRFFIPIAITVGRQPTTDGPPFEFKENRERQSTYPALVFDGEPDGIVVTLGFERWTGLKNSGLRYFYAMAYQHDDDEQWYLDGITGDNLKDTRVHGVFFETEIPKMRDSLLVLSYIPAADIVATNPATGAGDDLGDVTIYGAHLQFRDLFGVGLDVFGSYARNRNEPNGKTVQFGSLDVDGDGVGDMPMHLGLFNSAMAEDAGSTSPTEGEAFYVGFRYEIPVRFLEYPKIGFEYNKGSAYWFSFTPGPAEVYNKLATRGEVFDYYYTQPFNKYIDMRIGYTSIEYTHSNSTMPIGAPTDYKAAYGSLPKFENYYIMWECRF